MTHAELVTRAARWLHAQGCSVVLAELQTNAGYYPDAIGWRYGRSIVVEAKVSRADFFADRKKPIHQLPDAYPGQERVYLTPPGLVQPEELPPGWALVEAHARMVKAVYRPLEARFDRVVLSNSRAASEVEILLSALRRHQNPGYTWNQETARFKLENP